MQGAEELDRDSPAALQPPQAAAQLLAPGVGTVLGGQKFGGEWWGSPRTLQIPGGQGGHNDPYQPVHMQQVLRGHRDHLCPVRGGLQHTSGLGRERGGSKGGRRDPPGAFLSVPRTHVVSQDMGDRQDGGLAVAQRW